VKDPAEMTSIRRPWPSEQSRFFIPEGLPAETVVAADRFAMACQRATDSSLLGLKISLVTNLFLWHLKAFESEIDPIPGFVAAYNEAAEVIENAYRSAWFGHHLGSNVTDVSRNVGQVYSDAWQLLDRHSYFDQTYDRFLERFIRNGIDPHELFRDKIVLDKGCGCGNYAAAIARCGAKKVIAIDVGESGLTFGQNMIKESVYANIIDFRLGSAAAVPLPDACVDIVWSNSVVHVTGSYENCIAEAARVLRPGGSFFLYVDGKFGLFELLTNTLLCAMDGVPQSLFQHALAEAGVNSGRIGWMVANCYVAYERRPQVEVETLLYNCGFTDLRQLTHGTEFDQIEYVTQGRPFAKIKYGEAQLKYLCRRQG
jgi:ubiquinone/menaquinone biosynthesis C-methylase UbiE